VDVKKEKKKRKKYSESECVVCDFFYECFFLFMIKFAKNKEEFNSLICS